MKRIKYYITFANPDEFQKGIYHFSEPFSTLEEAERFERTLGSVNNTRCELHHEVFSNGEWLPDWDMSNWCEVIE